MGLIANILLLSSLVTAQFVPQDKDYIWIDTWHDPTVGIPDADRVMYFSTKRYGWPLTDDPADDQAVYYNMIRSAENWIRVECSDFGFRMDDPIFREQIYTTYKDGKSYLTWREEDTNSVYVFMDEGNREADIVIGTAYNWCFKGDIEPDEYDLETVYTHMYGHALGLSHSNNPESVMYPFLYEGQTKRELHEEDVENLCNLYK